jgi:hypothetical protein
MMAALLTRTSSLFSLDKKVLTAGRMVDRSARSRYKNSSLPCECGNEDLSEDIAARALASERPAR